VDLEINFHIIFVCEIDICPNIVLDSTVFSSFDPTDMPFGVKKRL
jgi:hypothetical protein